MCSSDLEQRYEVKFQDGMGGASKAFSHANGRRIDEIEHILGVKCVPGSLNMTCDPPFQWDRNYFRGQVLDVAERGKGLKGKWMERWARFYPVDIFGHQAYAFKFEGDSYPPNFVELIAEQKLRDVVAEPAVIVC